MFNGHAVDCPTNRVQGPPSESYLQWGLWQKKADNLAAENRQLRAQIESLTKEGRRSRDDYMEGTARGRED